MPSSDDERGRSTTPPGSDAPTAPYGTSEPSASTPGQITPEAALRPLGERFEILGELGRGGMGIVYRARDRETGEVVALKILKPEIASDSTVMERFKNELRLARKITHKNVCRTYDLHRFGQVAAIAMEYVDGESLRHILNRFGGLPLRKGLQVASQISGALKEAHSQSIVHRDLKPENIMLDREGNVKVMDFGIARSIETGTTLTGPVVGTPAYMAPEQAEGKRVDARADIYALGLILYEIFTGIPAFSGDTPLEVALKHIREAPTPPRGVEPTLPEHIEKAILKCLEKNPAKRFHSVDELEAALTKKPEAKHAVAEVEQAELPLPLHLARWQRSDYMLLAAALLGLLVFISLYDRTFPYSAMRIMPKEEAAKVVRAGLAKLGVDAAPQESTFGFEFWRYQPIAAMSGPATARHFLERWGSSSWSFRIEGPGIPKGGGTWKVINNGRTEWMFSLRPEIFPKEDNAQQEQDMMAKVASSIFAQDLSRTTPNVSSGSKVEEFVMGGDHVDAIAEDSIPRTYSYELPDPSLGMPMAFRVGLGRGFLWARLPGTLDWYENWETPRRLPAILALVTLCAAGLFFLRRLHRRPTSWPVLVPLLAATALGFLGITTQSSEVVRMVLLAALFLAGFTVVYCALAAAEYYLQRNDASRLHTFSDLFKHPVRSPGSGLAIARGVFLGFLCAGGYVLLLAILGQARLAFPATRSLEEVHFGPLTSASADSLVVALRSLGVVFIESFILLWLLVVLPASLLRRAVSRAEAIIPVIVLLWLAVPYSLYGMSVGPAAGWYASVALQGLFVSVIYLKWDLLTTVSTIFTVETWLVGYAVVQVCRTLDSSVYWLPIIVWLAFSLLGFAVYFRPQLVAGWRRVAAVFA